MNAASAGEGLNSIATCGRYPLLPERRYRGLVESSLLDRAESLHRLLHTNARPTPADFRAALTSVPLLERDVWVDAVLGLGPIPDDGPDLPPGGVAYLPCSVEAVLEAVDVARITAADVVVDLGAGVGRAAALLHLLTGARVIGVEVQRALVEAARSLSSSLPAVSFVHGDAAEVERRAPGGTVYFLYCPFSGARLERLLDDLERIASARPLRLVCIDLPLPPRSWLMQLSSGSGAVTVFTSTRNA